MEWFLTPAYLPGIANLGADARGKKTSEWFINPIVTRRMFRRFGHPQIDLFASNRSAQVETYFSLDRRDKLSTGTSALNQTWAFNLMYAFPPPHIIPLILARMKECKGTLILVTPFGPGQLGYQNSCRCQFWRLYAFLRIRVR